MQNWQEDTCVGAGLKLYKERESTTGIFLWFLWNFLRTLFLEHFWLPALLLLLKSPVFWSFLSSDLPDVYLWVFWFALHMFLFSYQVITIIQILLTLINFVLYVCWLNKLHLVFFFESMNWCKKEKKWEKPSECFTHGSEKTIRIFNQVLVKMPWASKLKLSSTIL